MFPLVSERRMRIRTREGLHPTRFPTAHGPVRRRRGCALTADLADDDSRQTAASVGD